MVATTCCFTAGSVGRRRIVNVGGTGFDAYERALTIPAARFTTGHDYVLICAGIAGNHIFNPVPAPAVQPTYVEVIPYLGTPQLGTPQLKQAYRQIFSFAPYLSALSPVQEVHTGQPFFMMLKKDNWPAATDFHLAAQLKYDGNPVNVRGSFDIDAMSVQVWDTTNLNALGIWWEWHENITEVDLPDSVAAPMTLQNFTRAHGTSVAWFIATYVNFTPKKEDEAAMFWLDDGAGVETFARRVKPFLHGFPAGGRYDWQSYPMGMLRTKVLPATWTLRSRAQDNYVAPIHGRHHVSATFAVSMENPDFFLQGPSVNPQPGFWGTEDPWSGDAAELQVTGFPYYIHGIVMAMVATAPIAGRWRTLLEADGSPISSNNPLAVLSIADPRESLPQVRVVTYVFGGGKHWLSYRGNLHWSDPEPEFFKYDAFDVFLFTFSGVLGVIPPADVFEGPGPESAVLASKETSVSVAALPALPFQPSFGAPVNPEGVTREMRTPTGYDVTHPKHEKSRRTVRMTWQALTADDAVTLVTWAKALADTDGAFRWQMTGDLAERPYSILEASIPEVDLVSGGPRSISFDAEELLFYVP